MIDLLVAFVLIFIVAFIVTTIQLAAAKNRFDHKWNNNYGHRFGNWCYLCVGFWLGAFISFGLLLVTDLTIPNYFLVIFAQPAISTYITLRLL